MDFPRIFAHSCTDLERSLCMYVLADVEWIENQQGLISFTQIAMLRVDEKWKPVREIFRRICPKDTSYYQWDHMAFTGGGRKDFLYAPNSYQAFKDIEAWLLPDDIICWWNKDSRDWIQKLIPSVSKPQIVINENVARFLGCYPQNPYQLGKKLKLPSPGEMHHSRSDVEMMRMVLEIIQFPNPIPHVIKASPVSSYLLAPNNYIAHIKTNRIHKKGCSCLPADGSTKGYNELKNAVSKNYIPCDCVKKEYLQARRAKNQSIIDRSEYCFIFSPDSQVFHRRDCKIALNAKQIMGTVLYHNCISTGRQPCKVCHPQLEDETYKHTHSGKKKTIKNKHLRSLAADEQRAIKRHRQAQEERMAYIRSGALHQEGSDDLYTLTQPRFAFWAATGYNTFHLRNCKKMSGLTNLNGFSQFSHAQSAGYRPCKCCKPTPKHDIHLSLPIYTKMRYGEDAQTLIDGCLANSYEYKQDGNQFTLETPVGIWKIDIAKKPYRMDHINTAINPDNRTSFHHQPRIFLSLKDAFFYIKRHDDCLITQATNGTA